MNPFVKIEDGRGSVSVAGILLLLTFRKTEKGLRLFRELLQVAKSHGYPRSIDVVESTMVFDGDRPDHASGRSMQLALDLAEYIPFDEAESKVVAACGGLQ